VRHELLMALGKQVHEQVKQNPAHYIEQDLSYDHEPARLPHGAVK
jgi:hypothetical protein